MANRVHKSKQYREAIDLLQREGFETELWIDHDTWMLRWIKKGAKWHVISHNQSPQDDVGIAALRWLKSRERGDGKETNYAVDEGAR